MNPSLITLLAYLIGLLPLMLLGFYFARRKMFTQHKLTMTTIFILNWLLIIWVMSPAYRALVSSEPPPDFTTLPVIVPTLHLLIGLIAQLMATYLVLLMWTEHTPLEKLIPFRIKNIKTPMRLTLTLWIITILGGVGIYAIRHGALDLGSPSTEITQEAPAPDATEAVEEPATTEQP